MTTLERLFSVWCKQFGHRMCDWFEANGPEGTVARFCGRCGRTEHLIHGEVWVS